MEFNDMTEEGLLGKDQFVYLHKKPKTGEKDFYIVQPGETLHDIAQKNAIQLRYLSEYNNLNTGVDLKVNTRLLLQPGLKTGTNSQLENKTKIHLVAPKEGLYAIARTYKVTVQQLREWNKLDSDDLKIGQEIIVSK
jgi:LysM repeat protein